MKPKLESRVTDDGKEQLYFSKLPAMAKFAHKATWRPQDAAKMQALTTTLFRGQVGTPLMIRTLFSAAEEEPVNCHLIAQEFASGIAKRQADPQFTTVLARDDFVDMVMAATITAPRQQLVDQDLIAPSGVIYFTNPQDLSIIFEGQNVGPRATGIRSVRGIEWISWESAEGPSIVWFLLVDGPILQESTKHLNLLFPEEFYLYTIPYAFGISPINNNSRLPMDHDVIDAMLKAATAIISSPMTHDQTVTAESAKAKKARQRKGKAALSDIRVLSLHNPEHGRYELDAATGRKLRAHWVRGHWRNQWYAKTNEHQTIWIDGFVKGDAERGTLTGPKVYVARAPQTEEMDRTQTNN